MSAHFRRIIHQQAQLSSLESCYSNLENQTVVLMSKYIEQQQSFPGFFAKLLLQDTPTVRRYNYETASKPLLPTVACCISVLSSRYIGKCAAPVLKCSDHT